MSRLGRLAARLLRARLVQLFALGGLLFALMPPAVGGATISLPEPALSLLRSAEARRRGVARLDPASERALDAQAAEDELLYREALRLGLDRSDGVVRQRLVQKVLFLAEDLGGASRAATEAEVRAYLAAHAARYQRPARLHLVQVFARSEAAAAALRPEVCKHREPTAPPLGEAFTLPREVSATRAQLASLYGVEFAAAVDAARPGEWTGPIASKFGHHLVRVIERLPGGAAPFAEVEGRVRFDLDEERRQRAIARFIEQAAARYHITLAGAPFTPQAGDRLAAVPRAPEGQAD